MGHFDAGERSLLQVMRVTSLPLSSRVLLRAGRRFVFALVLEVQLAILIIASGGLAVSRWLPGALAQRCRCLRGAPCSEQRGSRHEVVAAEHGPDNNACVRHSALVLFSTSVAVSVTAGFFRCCSCWPPPVPSRLRLLAAWRAVFTGWYNNSCRWSGKHGVI